MAHAAFENELKILELLFSIRGTLSQHASQNVPSEGWKRDSLQGCLEPNTCRSAHSDFSILAYQLCCMFSLK